MKLQLVGAAYLLDWLIGDPEKLPHPVRLFGGCISWADKNCRCSEAKKDEFAAGCVLAIGLPVVTILTVKLVLRQAQRRHRLLRRGLEVMFAASCLATRNLLDEADHVVSALEMQNLPAARTSLARIVGRDTQILDASEISRAVIETLAESLSDGVIAPLFYLTAGGVPMALAYKAINTMDSMIGHKDKRYFYFGKAAARLDDIANIIPSRISALLLCAVAACFPRTSCKNAWQTWLADGNKHESPNSGQSESAMAGALSVRLGGGNFYDGERVDAPLIGERYEQPSISHARTAMKLTAAASVLGCGVALFYLWKRR
jgi:adenosylcobinamide-phosphate synthase